VVASFPRVEAALGGSSIATADEETLQVLVKGQVREDTEIDFKAARYGTSDRNHRDLAVDVAALANSLGGVIFLGIREEGGIAIELTPVSLDEGEEIRMRQILASLVAPAPQIDILRVESRDDPARGYYLLAVPVSPWRPHAVRINTALRYPHRDGPHIRYLSETEVADAYRSRFTAEADQAQRLTQIHSEGLERVSTDHQLWLTVALVPDVPGAMRLDRAALQGFRAFAERYNGGFGSMVFGGFDFATGLRRVILRTGPELGLSTVAHVELHTEGSSFAATSLWTERDQPPGGRLPEEGSQRTPWLEDESLVTQLLALLGLVVEHAVVHCGVSGDAAVRVSLDGYDRGDGRYRYPPRLMHRRNFGIPEPRRGHQLLLRPPISLHTVDAATCSSSTTELLVACHSVLMDLFQAFGVPEVEQINEDGALRIRYFSPPAHAPLRAWAESHDVNVVTSSLEEEGV